MIFAPLDGMCFHICLAAGKLIPRKHLSITVVVSARQPIPAIAEDFLIGLKEFYMHAKYCCIPQYIPQQYAMVGMVDHRASFELCKIIFDNRAGGELIPRKHSGRSVAGMNRQLNLKMVDFFDQALKICPVIQKCCSKKNMVLIAAGVLPCKINHTDTSL